MSHSVIMKKQNQAIKLRLLAIRRNIVNRLNLKRNFNILVLGLLILSSTTFLSFAGDHTVYTIKDLKSVIYQEMTNRSNIFNVDYSGSSVSTFTDDSQSFMRSVYAGEDDYLEWNLSEIAYQYYRTDNLLKIEFTAKYLTTKAQEIYVDENVKIILASIIKANMTDDEKLSAIHQYIIDNVEYDKSLTKYTAYNALYDGTAVCQGYSLLMDKMLEAAGVKTIIIDGSIPEGTHAWNLVLLDGIWYHVDATNDDINRNKYYLKTDDFMLDNDYKWDSSLFPDALTDYHDPDPRVKVFVDNQEVAFDTQPYINGDNRTMVPVRFVSESLGASVYWDEALRLVTIINGQDEIKMTINNKIIYLNGVGFEMDTEAVLLDGRTMVPLRFISEYLGATVDWDSINNIVHVNSF
jgi:transglutaminase-like putative cysteine protease